jgi:hypothetical protein
MTSLEIGGAGRSGPGVLEAGISRVSGADRPWRIGNVLMPRTGSPGCWGAGTSARGACRSGSVILMARLIAGPGCRWCPRSASGRGIRLPAVPVSCSCITVSDEGDQGERTPARRSVADSASLIELSRARRSGCSASCWPGCSLNVGVVTSCWKVASLELAFASVAGCWSRMTAHLRRSGTRPRSRARRSAAGCGCGIVIRERPPSAAFS